MARYPKKLRTPYTDVRSGDHRRSAFILRERLTLLSFIYVITYISQKTNIQFEVSTPVYAPCTCRATHGAHRWNNRVQRHSHRQQHHTDNATRGPQEMFPTLMQLTRATTTFAAHGCRAAGARRTNSDDSWTTGAKLRPLKSEAPPRKLRQMPFT